MATLDYVHHLAFPKLSDSEVESLAGLATICSLKDGELIFQAGQRGLPFYVVESGEIAIVDESTDVSKMIVVHSPREFTGDVSLLTDLPAAISAYATPGARPGPTASARPSCAGSSRRSPTSATSCVSSGDTIPNSEKLGMVSLRQVSFGREEEIRIPPGKAGPAARDVGGQPRFPGTRKWVAPCASGNLRLGHRAPRRGGRRASIPFKALPTLLSSLGAFCLFELRVSRTFLDQLRPQLSGSVGLLACPLFAGIHRVIIRELLGRAALGTGIKICPVSVPSRSRRFHSF